MIRDFIPDPDLDFLPIPDPRVKKALDLDPQHCLQPMCNTTSYYAYASPAGLDLANQYHQTGLNDL
jgi:hypothetical protein